MFIDTLVQPKELNQIAKEVYSVNPHSDLIGDISVYLSGSVDGFPKDGEGQVLTKDQVADKYALRADKVTRTSIIRFLSEICTGNLDDQKLLGLYPNLIQRATEGQGQLPMQVYETAHQHLYCDLGFPHLSLDERNKSHTADLEHSFLSNRQLGYWGLLKQMANGILGRNLSIGTRNNRLRADINVNLQCEEKKIDDFGLHNLVLVNKSCLAYLRNVTQAVFDKWPEGSNLLRYSALPKEEKIMLSECSEGLNYLSFPWSPDLSSYQMHCALEDSFDDHLIDAMRNMRLAFHLGGTVLEDGVIGSEKKIVQVVKSTVDFAFVDWLQQNKEIESVRKVLEYKDEQ